MLLSYGYYIIYIALFHDIHERYMCTVKMSAIGFLCYWLLIQHGSLCLHGSHWVLVNTLFYYTMHEGNKGQAKHIHKGIVCTQLYYCKNCLKKDMFCDWKRLKGTINKEVDEMLEQNQIIFIVLCFQELSDQSAMADWAVK